MDASISQGTRKHSGADNARTWSVRFVGGPYHNRVIEVTKALHEVRVPVSGQLAATGRQSELGAAASKQQAAVYVLRSVRHVYRPYAGSDLRRGCLYWQFMFEGLA
jgi:hypothetical protein